MTPRSRQRASTALVLLVACRPLVYTLDEDDGGDTGDTTGPGDPTGHGPTGPTPPDPNSCFDGDHGEDETDVDCGGPCPPCADGRKCQQPADCQSDACILGVCAQVACQVDVDCKVEGPCLEPVCDPGGGCGSVPAFDGEPCEDGDPCTDFSQCTQGKCIGEPRTCEELAGPCRVPFCNAQTGNCAVEFEPPGSFCDDGKTCSEFDMCDEFGACTGQPAGPLFYESFLMHQGWTTDPMWQIGPAFPSMCGMPGVDDPFTDHGGDQLLAGLLIGECAPMDGFPYNCLTSPKLGFMVPPDEPLMLSYWSHLSTAGDPMKTTVEVFDGQVWTVVESIDGPVFSEDWTETQLLLPPQPLVQVRFCQGQMGPGMFAVGGWSVDDVAIGRAACAP